MSQATDYDEMSGCRPRGSRGQSAPTARVVVAGLGSEHRHDDGAGPIVAQLVADMVPEVRAVGPLDDPLDLLGRWEGAELVVVVDALRSGRPPGSIVVVELTAPLEANAVDDGALDGRGAEPALGAGRPSAGASAPATVTSTHGIGLASLWHLARVIGDAPRRVVVVGIEAELFGAGVGLSPAVAAAIPDAAERVAELVGAVARCA